MEPTKKLSKTLLGAGLAILAGWCAVLVAPTGASAQITIDSTIHGNVRDHDRDGTPDTTDTNIHLFIANANAPGSFVGIYRPIIEFDISGLACAVTQADLFLTRIGYWYISAPLFGNPPINVFGYTGDGVLTLSDFDEVSFFLTSFNHFLTGGNTNVTLDVTSFINARIAANDTWAGFVLDLPGVTGNQYAVYGSNIDSQPPDGSTYPDLNVTTVPCPEATFLLIDEDSIDSDVPSIEALADGMGVDSADLVNDAIADVGVRDVLPIPVGTVLALPTGQVGDEGWFALKETSIPDTWDAAGPDDGLRNYINAVPGLGTGDDPEILLDKIPDVTPLRTAGLELLEDTTVCALVYKSDISINYDPLNGNLQGATRGLIAFDVVAVGPPSGSSVLPEMTVEIVDAAETCEGELVLFEDAPEPISSSEPSP